MAHKKRANSGDDSMIAAQPFLKWAGGKWNIADQIAALLPADARERPYREPFLGGGAMFFYLQPEEAYLSDALADLIATYEVVSSHVEALIHRLEALEKTHDEAQFYAIRTRYNEEKDAPKVDRAAWTIYLNKTCYNGLYRTNSKGAFNTPVGKYVNPKIVERDKLRLAQALLSRAELSCAKFDALLDIAHAGDVIYMDPPYVPLSKTASFAAYADGAFGLEDQNRLASVFKTLDEKGCLLALSNSDTPEVRKLYSSFDLSPIIAPRAISSKIDKREAVTELLIRNRACVTAAKAR